MKEPNRRNFLRKILTLAASAGAAGLLLDRLPRKGILQPVQAQGTGTDLTVDGNAGTGVGTTQLSSSGNPAFLSTNTGNGAALQGTCTAGSGVLGTTTTGTGVQGTAGAGGTALAGFAGDPGAIPIVAQGYTGQTANLQEWRGSSGAALSVVNASGSLGIGTASPLEALHVNGAIKFAGQTRAPLASCLGIDDYENTGRILCSGPNPSTVGNFYVNLLSGDYSIGVIPFFISGNGNVGIGTTSPAYPLDVAGSVHATSFPTSSDMRFKEDITPIDNALDKVLRLNGVYFKWNRLHRETLKRSNTLTSRQVGLIAQQVREVLPEVVSEWADQGADDYLAVDYSRLVAITIEAVKELATRNSEQQTEIQRLLERIAALEEKMN